MSRYNNKIMILVLTAWAFWSAAGCATAPTGPPAPLDASLEEAVKRKWDDPAFTSVTTWVNYSPDLESRSEANFFTGTLTFTAIVALETADPQQTGADKIAGQVRRTLAARTPQGIELLADQVAGPQGEAVSPDRVEPFIEKVVLPKLIINGTAYTANDGIRRVSMTSRIELLPDHVRVRARQYAPLVWRAAQRFDLDPALVMAMIHTESHFNPMARSGGGAIGLMQVIPRFAGLEAYLLLHKEEQIPDESYVYDPENNVLLGTAYYHLLKTRFFGKVRDPVKNRYLSLASYNLGPTIVRSRITPPHRPARLSRQALLAVIRRHTPAETRGYLDGVLGRMPMYKGFFGKGGKILARLEANREVPPDRLITPAGRE